MAGRTGKWLRSRGPGIALVAGAAAVSQVASLQIKVVSALLIAIALGVALRNTVGVPAWAAAGLGWSGKTWLRGGVVLLGFQLSLPQVARLGAGGVGVILITVTLTYSVTLALGRVLRVSPLLSKLVATGFSICGAAAIAASSGILDPEGEHEDDTATAVALVTLYGTVMIALMPWLSGLLGFSDDQRGIWIGASVHEVAQVVAAGALVGTAALATATVTKLGRVVLLAPLAFAQSLAQSRRSSGQREEGKRPPLIPLFVVGFLVAMGVRSFDVVPDGALAAIKVVSTFALTGAMFCLGTGVHLRTLMRTGARAILLGLASTAVALATSGLAIAVLT